MFQGAWHHEEEDIYGRVPNATTRCAVSGVGILEFPPFLDIYLVPRMKLIDVDEFGVLLEKCNRTGGLAVKVLRVQKDGHYHHGMTLRVIFAIEPGELDLPDHVCGSVKRPR
jgi:hypothetical protein